MVAALEADDPADAASRVRSEQSVTETTAREIAACHDQSVGRVVSNVLHELAIDGTAGPAARRFWPR
jgi:hypothetical protein